MSADMPSSSFALGPSSVKGSDGENSVKNFSNNPAVVTTTNRENMVEAARQFLQNPRVRGTPDYEQRKFLRDKGLNDAEIDEAFKSLPNTAILDSVQNVSDEGFSRFLFTCQSVVLVAGASYAAYKLVRSWLLPKYFDIPDPDQERVESLQNQMNDLQNSSKFIMDSVIQTLESVSTQQEQLNRAIMLLSSSAHNGMRGNAMEILQADVNIVKSLLLSQNQFPPIPDHQSGRTNERANGYTKATNIVKNFSQNGTQKNNHNNESTNNKSNEDGNDNDAITSDGPITDDRKKEDTTTTTPN